MAASLTAEPEFWQWHGSCLELKLFVQPRASRDRCCGRHGDALKIQITAPPVEGEANQHLLAWLAKAFAVPKQRVSLKSGLSGRHKQVCIEQPVQIPDWLMPFMESV